MDGPPQEQSRPRRGCLIALAVLVAVGGLCGAGATCLGLSAVNDPGVQLGVRAAGAAMEMNQEALRGPGAQSLRDAGCRHAMAYTTAQMVRFVEQVGPEAQLSAPGSPLLVCASAGAPPDCAQLARAYAEAVPDAGSVLVGAFDAETPEAVCAGRFDREGERERDLDAAEARFVEVVRPRVF